MFPNTFSLLLTCSALWLVTASPALSPITSTTSEVYGLYEIVHVPASNISFEMHVRGFTGTPSHKELDLSDFDKVYSPMHFESLSTRAISTGSLEERDICAFFSDCAQSVADTATTSALYIANTGTAYCQAVYTNTLAYWQANNYANVNTVALGLVIGFFFTVVQTPIGNAIWNAETAQTNGNDGCSVDSDPALTANYFASSLYDFCMAIQAAKSTANINSDYVYGEFSNTNGDVADGNVGITRNFIAAQSGNFGPSCSALGITWKKMLARSAGFLGLGSR